MVENRPLSIALAVTILLSAVSAYAQSGPPTGANGCSGSLQIPCLSITTVTAVGTTDRLTNRRHARHVYAVHECQWAHPATD